MRRTLFTKNFILLILGQASSLFGNFVLKLALSMYILETTGSAAIFAGLLSAATVPTILLSPFGGILADRANRKTIMVALDAATGTAVFCAAFALSQGNAVVVIGTLLVILSVLGAFETPTVQACIPQMLSGDDIVRGNAIVNQVASVACLIAPTLGGILYAAVGLKPVMYATTACFLATAFLECMIRLAPPCPERHAGLLSTVKQDFSESIRFILKEQPEILRMLLLTSLSRFFVMGVTIVGLPYIVRTVLGLDAACYGATESLLAVAAICGSVAAGLLTGKQKYCKLSLVLEALGGSILVAGVAFVLPITTMAKYALNAAAFCGMQAAISIFSIFAVSRIQQKTPNHLLGKVMSYTAAITLCAQPAGQLLYGFLFDLFRHAVSLVLLPTGAIVWGIGLLDAASAKRADKKPAQPASHAGS